jgi:glycosyltransferase involved in cell wall biosynthesis
MNIKLVPAVLTVVPKIPLKGVYYIGQYGTSGYAQAAKGYLYHYFSNSIPITWEPLYFDNSKLSEDNIYDVVIKSLINRPIAQHDMVIMHCTPDLWPKYWQEKPKILEGKIVNGYCTWETNRLPKSWVECMNRYVNEVWCPSTYNADSFRESGVTKPIRVVPHIFLPQPLPDPNSVKLVDMRNGDKVEKDGRYTFYTIGEFNARKGIEDTIQAFCEAFKETDPVRLILKVHYRSYLSENKATCENLIVKELKKYPYHPPVVCLLENMSATELLALHSIGDCYLALTKAEGFGLTIFDAHNYGKKVIATGYSGHVDFLGKNYPGLIRYKVGPVKGMASFSLNYSEEQSWAYPDVEHAIELMRKAVNL